MDQHHNAQTAHKTIDLEALSARIRSTPPPVRKLTRRASVEVLRPDLMQALATGHTPVSLAALLQEDGLKVAPRTLASWLNVSSRSASKPRTRKQAKTPTA